WVVTNAPDESRGRIVGGYILVLSGSYMIGPLLLKALGTDTWLIYAVPTVIILASAVPLILGRAGIPEPRPDEAAGLFTALRYFRTDPMVTFGVVLFGVIEFGAMGLIAVWGLRSGFEQETAVAFVFWLAFGSALCQVPVGWAADRFDRRRLLAGAAVISIAAPLVLIAAAREAWIVNAAVAVWGGTAVAFYSIALTELGSRYSGQAMAQANAAVVLAYGLGSLAAPAAFGLAMDLIPPDGLLWLAVLAACGYLALAIVRIQSQRRAPLDRPTGSDR
ncbi:MAG: MFS transporter, partial [Pseudomonadota bacterium]